MIMPGLRCSSKDRAEIQDKIDEHASNGFRTMVCAYRIMDRKEYVEFKRTIETLVNITTQ